MNALCLKNVWIYVKSISPGTDNCSGWDGIGARHREKESEYTSFNAHLEEQNLMCPIKKTCTVLKIQQHSFDIQVLQTQGLYLKSLLFWVGAVEQEQGLSPPSLRSAPRAFWTGMPALLTLLLEKFWDYESRLRWDLSAPLALCWHRAQLPCQGRIVGTENTTRINEISQGNEGRSHLHS